MEGYDMLANESAAAVYNIVCNYWVSEADSSGFGLLGPGSREHNTNR